MESSHFPQSHSSFPEAVEFMKKGLVTPTGNTSPDKLSDIPLTQLPITIFFEEKTGACCVGQNPDPHRFNKEKMISSSEEFRWAMRDILLKDMKGEDREKMAAQLETNRARWLTLGYRSCSPYIGALRRASRKATTEEAFQETWDPNNAYRSKEVPVIKLDLSTVTCVFYLTGDNQVVFEESAHFGFSYLKDPTEKETQFCSRFSVDSNGVTNHFSAEIIGGSRAFLEQLEVASLFQHVWNEITKLWIVCLDVYARHLVNVADKAADDLHEKREAYQSICNAETDDPVTQEKLFGLYRSSRKFFVEKDEAAQVAIENVKKAWTAFGRPAFSSKEKRRGDPLRSPSQRSNLATGGNDSTTKKYLQLMSDLSACPVNASNEPVSALKNPDTLFFPQNKVSRHEIPTSSPTAPVRPTDLKR